MSNVCAKPDIPEGIIPGEPTWDVARLYPAQGSWSEGDYLELDTNQLVEFSQGFVHFLPSPSILHQRILKHLFHELHAYIMAAKSGEVFFRGLPVRTGNANYRQPDLLFVCAENVARLTERYSDSADLVMEIVGDQDEDRRRVLEAKRHEYAQAGIPEYWIVDPKLGLITVLVLEGSSYAVHGEFARGEIARCKLLPEFAVGVATALSGTI